MERSETQVNEPEETEHAKRAIALNLAIYSMNGSRPLRGLLPFYSNDPGVPLRSTPGRGPQPSISAGVRDFMLPPRYGGLRASSECRVQGFLQLALRSSINRDWKRQKAEHEHNQRDDANHSSSSSQRFHILRRRMPHAQHYGQQSDVDKAAGTAVPQPSQH